MEALLDVLSGFFLYDMKVFSNPWMYIPLLVPATAYLCFFIIKWAVISLPLWLPMSIIFTPIMGGTTSSEGGSKMVKLKKVIRKS